MRKLTLNEFIIDSGIVHNNKYDYSKVIYKNSQTKVEIICPIHGLFFQLPNNHKIHKMGCKSCSDEKKADSQRYTTKQFINKSKIIHGNTYDYSETNYKSYHKKLNIICPIHGKFNQEAGSHLQGCGCPECKKIKIGNKNRKLLEQFIFDANIIHKNEYKYSQFIYVNSHTHGKIICKKHGEFSQSPTNHLKGDGCPNCGYNISQPEINFLDHINLPKEWRHKYIKPYKVDGYDMLTRTIYEFLGDYWHGNPELYDMNKINQRTKITYGEMYNKTMFRLKKLKSLGYNVKYIWETDWNRFKKGMDNIPNITTI